MQTTAAADANYSARKKQPHFAHLVRTASVVDRTVPDLELMRTVPALKRTQTAPTLKPALTVPALKRTQPAPTLKRAQTAPTLMKRTQTTPTLKRAQTAPTLKRTRVAFGSAVPERSAVKHPRTTPNGNRPATFYNIVERIAPRSRTRRKRRVNKLVDQFNSLLKKRVRNSRKPKRYMLKKQVRKDPLLQEVAMLTRLQSLLRRDGIINPLGLPVVDEKSTSQSDLSYPSTDVWI